MTQRFTNDLGTFAIPNGQTVSNVLTGLGSYSDAEAFTLMGNVVDGTKTYNIQLSHDNATWFTWTSDGIAAYAVPLNGLARTYPNPCTRYMRIISTLAGTGATWQIQTSFYE